MAHKYKKAARLPFLGGRRRVESPPPSCLCVPVPCPFLGVLGRTFLCSPPLPGPPAEELRVPPSKQRAVLNTTRHQYPRQGGRRRNRPKGISCKQRHHCTPKKEERCGREMMMVLVVHARLTLALRVTLSVPCPPRPVLAGVPETLSG